jgi:hypothetical protein
MSGFDQKQELAYFFFGWTTLVEHIKFFSEKIDERLLFFSPIFSVKKQVKNVKVFSHFSPHFYFESKNVRILLHFSPVFSLKK